MYDDGLYDDDGGDGEHGLPPVVVHWLVTAIMVATTGVLMWNMAFDAYGGAWGNTAIQAGLLAVWVGLMMPWHLRHLPSR